MKLLFEMHRFSTYGKLLIIFLYSIFTEKALAQLNFSDSIQISLLTCSEGPDAYERFGHSAVRILDHKQPGQDIVFHWGVFNFNAPHFVYRFVKGETDYQLGATYTEYFFEEYAQRGLAMKEQVLNLDQEEASQALTAILTNYRPENRVYRYSFFFDNCATRPFNIIEKSTGNKIAYDTTWVEPITLRDMVQQKSGINNWLDFGISLAVAGRSDKVAAFREQMFLPEYLAKAYDNAFLGEKKFVKEERQILEMRPEIRKKIDHDLFITSPLVVFVALLVILLLLQWRKKTSSKTEVCYKIFESLVLIATGVTGTILWFLNFVSVHPAVDHNLNCLWLLPTNIIFAALIWVKSAEKVNRIYFFIIFALIIAYAIINIAFDVQYLCPQFILPLFILLFISKEHIVKKK